MEHHYKDYVASYFDKLPCSPHCLAIDIKQSCRTKHVYQVATTAENLSTEPDPVHCGSVLNFDFFYCVNIESKNGASCGRFCPAVCHVSVGQNGRTSEFFIAVTLNIITNVFFIFSM